MSTGKHWVLSCFKESVQRKKKYLQIVNVLCVALTWSRSVVLIEIRHIDEEIYAVQLSFTDDVFNHGINLLMSKCRTQPSLGHFCDYFNEQWVGQVHHPHSLFDFHFRYKGCALNLPSTNNACESFNAKIKRQYTVRSMLLLSSFLPKMELILVEQLAK